MRLAVKVAYDGTRFAGSQVQPGVRTVHGEVAEALRKLGHDAPRLAWAGRTDAGVSAAGNVVAFETHMAPDALLPALTHAMDDAWAWAWAEVDEAFEPRHARRRVYRYHLRSALDAASVESAMQAFVGEHDFSSFARVEPNVSPRRRVDAVRARREGPFVVIDVDGPNFLWNQVRRMVEAGRRVAAGEARAEDVRAALDEGRAQDFGVAPPEPLVLLDVEYERVAFQAPPPDLARRMLARLERRVEAQELSLAVLRTLAPRAPEAP